MQPHRAHGMEWLPAPSTTSTSLGPTRPARPLVVILPWMWAARVAVYRHVALYHSLGCDVAVLRGWPALSVWLPALARRNAQRLLTALASHLSDHPRDVVLACFSGAAKGVLCPLLARLLPGPAAAAEEEVAAVTSAAAVSNSTASGLGGPGDANRPTPLEADAPGATAAAETTLAATGHFGHVMLKLRGALPAVWRRGGASSQPPPSRSSPPLPPPPPQQQQRCKPKRPSPGPDPDASLLLQHLRGLLFDSGPVDFDSSVGVRLFANSRHPTLRAVQAAAGAAAAGALDFCLYELFESQRRAMWVGLRHCLAAARLPVLFLYSWSEDALADPQPIHALAVALRSEIAAAEPGPAAVQAEAGIGAAATEAAGDVIVAAGPSRAALPGNATCSSSSNSISPGGCCAAAAAGAVSVAGGADTACRTSAGGPRSGGGSAARPSSLLAAPRRLDGRNGTGGGGGGPVGAAEAPCSSGCCTVAAPARCAGGQGAAAAAAVGAAPAAVWEQGWDSSPHVAHLRQHPEQYGRVVSVFLENCLRATGEVAAT